MEHEAIRVAFDTRSLLVRLWRSGHLAQQALPDAVLMHTPDSDEAAPAYEVSAWGGQEPSVVLFGEPPALSPQILAHEWSGRAWLAHGFRLYGLPSNPAKATWVILDTLIVEARIVAHLESIVVICEANVVTLDAGLQVRWSLATDLITNHVWQSNVVIIRQFVGPDLLVDLETGSCSEQDRAQPHP